MQTHFSLKNILVRGALTGAFFVIFWSGWAYYSNLMYGESEAVRAAITQGSFTLVNTFVYTVFMEYMFAISKSKTARFMMAFILPNIIATVALAGVHISRGTPNILQTIMPILLVFWSLSLVYITYIVPDRKVN
jgi:hypothetical protein